MQTVAFCRPTLTARSRCGLIALLLLASASTLLSQAASSAQAPARKTSKPYTGDLSIFDSPGRDQRLHIQQVMDALNITPGKNVADIGAGGGWFTVRAAKRVGDSGKVYAVDINPDATKYIAARAQKEHLSNIDTIVSKTDDPLIPASSVDAVLLLKTYHEVSNPIALMHNLRPALRSGAKVGIIDRNGNGENHGVNHDVVVHELEQAGYRLVGEKDDLVKPDEMDYLLIFSP